MDTTTIFLMTIISLFIISIIISGVMDNIKFKRFKAKLYPGATLTKTFKLIDDEFDEGHVSKMTISKVGKNQVQVFYSDGSGPFTKDIYNLYCEGWDFSPPC